MAPPNQNHAFIRNYVDLWLPATLGVFGLAVLLYLASSNANPSKFQLQIYLTLLALSSAAFAALIPGLLNVKLEGPGFAIRAAGALGVFVLVFFYEPAGKNIVDSITPPVAQPINPASDPLITSRREQLVRMAADADAQIRRSAQDLRFSTVSSSECFMNRKKIDQSSSPASSLEAIASRIQTEPTAEEYEAIRRRIVEGSEAAQRTIRALVSQAIQLGCVGR